MSQFPESLSDRYKVIKCLGTGPIGTVYLCEHLGLAEAKCCLKIFPAEVLKDEIKVAYLMNAIFASYGLASQANVITSYEFIRQSDFLAYSMEYFAGKNLAEYRAEQDRLDIQQSVRILKQICTGLEAMHENGLLHRTLRPGCILLDKELNVKISSLDQGLVVREDPKKSSYVITSMDYVPPEYLLESKFDVILINNRFFRRKDLLLMSASRILDLSKFGSQQQMPGDIQESSILSGFFVVDEYICC